MTATKEEIREYKARALEEAANVDGLFNVAAAKALIERANMLRGGVDPAAPDEPLEAGSRCRDRAGREYLRWCTGTSHTSQPWCDPRSHLEAGDDNFFRFEDLDVVEVWPASPLPELKP